MKNMPNIINLSEDQTLYRYFIYEYLLDLFKNKRNTLNNTYEWNDPFENFFYESHYLSEHGKPIGIISRDRMYGQCWTLNEESDAQWHCYSKNAHVIKVKSKLINVIAPLKKIKPDFVYFGKVDYLSESQLLTFLKTYYEELLYGTDQNLRMQTLFMKRIPFSYENEVRIIYYNIEGSIDGQPKRYTYNIEPNDLIFEIVFSPWEDDIFVQRSTLEIRQLGYLNKIYKSDLYSYPNIIFDIHKRTHT
ncbi:MAG: hypothetical protein ABSG15_13405 [FCB group bacterium]|jgi:hypothetical protein